MREVVRRRERCEGLRKDLDYLERELRDCLAAADDFRLQLDDIAAGRVPEQDVWHDLHVIRAFLGKWWTNR
jgi:hypothetical protein